MNSLFRSSPKIYRKYKCDDPSKTIRRLREGFRQYRLFPRYRGQSVAVGSFRLYSGAVELSRFRLTYNGKGISRALSEASALAELAERFSAFERFEPGNELLLRRLKTRDPWSLLKGYQPKAPDRALLKKAYRFLLSPKIGPSDCVLRGLRSQGMFDTWVDADDIIRNTSVQLPIKLVHAISGSNGLAAGNTLEEAAAQGLGEVLERYAQALFLIKQEPAPTVSLKSIRDPQLRHCLDLFHKMGYRILVKDLSFGFGMPVVGIVVIDDRLRNHPNPYIRRYHRQFRAGCHPDRRQALLRCFTEELQGTGKAGYTKGRFLEPHSFWRKWAREDPHIHPRKYDRDAFTLRLIHKGRLAGDTSFLDVPSESVSFSDLPTMTSDDARDDLEFLAEVVHAMGRRSYVVDCTDRVLRFPVVRVVVPGISDFISYFNPKWIGNNGITPYLLSLDHNLLPFAQNDTWTKSPQGIRRLLNVLEEFFCHYGTDAYIPVGNRNPWLFHLAYRLCLFVGDHHRALRYYDTIRSIKPGAVKIDPALAKVVGKYLRLRASGKTEDDAFRIILKQRGSSEQRLLRRILHDHDLTRVSMQNPFSG